MIMLEYKSAQLRLFLIIKSKVISIFNKPEAPQYLYTYKMDLFMFMREGTQ